MWVEQRWCMVCVLAAMTLLLGGCLEMLMGSRHPSAENERHERRPDFRQDLAIDFTGRDLADATSAAAIAGWRGHTEIRADAHDPQCKADTVCSFEPRDWKFDGEEPTLVFHVIASPRP